MMRKYIYLLITAFTFSCIDHFEQETGTFQKGILVVDGTIAATATTVRLSRSVGIEMESTESVGIDNATLYVACDDGSRFSSVAYRGEGMYEIETPALDPGKQYCLHISLGDGEEYESSFLTPLFTPEIDSISWQKQGRGETVYITVSTHDEATHPPYYRWTYSEDWEFKSELYATAGFVATIGGVDYFKIYDLQTSNNIYYCWGSSHSAGFILGSSERLSSNTISHNRLTGIEPSHEKLSILYYISVSQQQLRKEAYDYYMNLQKNISQSGSIFSPIPAEMTGNIRCLTHPDRPAIGYVEVSNIVSADLFIPESSGLYEPPIGQCPMQVVHRISKDYISNTIYEFIQEQGQGPEPYMVVGLPMSYAPVSCMDCTTRGTKKKPPLWPTDHL
ncbi:MAG: DUF4249 domain-containing protein [Tannerellaceae bacterium]|jgi:hypothetical protein|nr:DUF4249 domain-containing protein [Tannerellaceae bacterium]